MARRANRHVDRQGTRRPEGLRAPDRARWGERRGALRRPLPRPSPGHRGRRGRHPEAERDLLGLAAGESLRGLADEAARRKAEVENLEAREQRIRRDRRCRTWTDRDGAWNLAARGPLTDGSAFMVELERLADLAFREARTSGIREGHDAYAFDALMNLGGRSRQADDPPTEPASYRSPRPELRPKPRRADNVRHLGLVHVDLAALVRGFVEGDERCELPGLGPISVMAARELLGDCILKLVISNGVDVLNVTHLGRGPNAAQQIAVLWSQPLCSVRGCNRRARLQHDHRHPYASDRCTHVSNIDRLCEHHHDRKTRHGWALVGGRGRRDLVPPTDPRHPNSARLANAP